MNRFLLVLLLGILVSVFMFVCFKHSPAVDAQAHRTEIEQWQQNRLARLTRDDGWLTLVGLYWLKEGENTVGSDSSNAVVLPSKTPPLLGTIVQTAGTVYFQVKPGVEVLHNDVPVLTSLPIQTDESPDPTILRHGTVSFYVIKRGNQLGVRVKDKESSARTHFKGLDYFDIDPNYRFEARFEPYNPPKILEIPSQVGTVEKDSCPGQLAFDYEGKTYRIDAIVEQGSEDQFFIMFTDETNGKETYQVGRQLYTSLPDSTGHVVLDFNKAYNWPCVFTEFATCPIPPRQNHLAFRMEAGEKMYSGHE